MNKAMVAHDMQDLDALAEAGLEDSLPFGTVILLEGGYIEVEGVRPQGAEGRDHPLWFEQFEVTKARDGG